MTMACSTIANSLQYSSGLGGGQTQLSFPLSYLTGTSGTIRREGQPTKDAVQGSPDSLGEGLDEV